MQPIVETTSPLGRKMKIVIPSEMIESEINKRVKEATKKARLDGFRPGKVPEKVIRERFGEGIQYEALNELVRESLFDALKQEKLNPAGQPEVNFAEPYKAGTPLEYTAQFEVFPEIVLKPFGELIIEKLTADVTEEDIEKTLEGMRKQKTLWKHTDRPAQEGDKLTINFEGKIDNVPFEGGKAENVPLVLGSKSMIPGFEEGLIGATAGKEIVINVTFPENYHAKELAGKAAEFSVFVHDIEEPLLPELDEKFAEEFGVKEGDMEKLREEVRKTLTKQLTSRLRHQVKSEVMSKLSDSYKEIEIPKALIHHEAHALMHQMEHQLAQFKMSKSPELKEEMFAERAKNRVLLGLVLNKIASQYSFKAEATRVRQLIEEIAEDYDQPEAVVQSYYRDRNHLANIESLALEEQIVDKILSEATVVEKQGNISDILSREREG